MKQFKSGVEYIMLDLQGESAEVFSLVVNSKECQLPSLHLGKSPPPLVTTIIAHKSYTLPKGHTSTSVVGLCIDGSHLGDWREESIITCLDSGSDLTLVSEAALAHLKKPPRIHSVRGFQLKGVTGEARVKGYMNLKLWLWSEEGIWVEFLEEAWVLRDLKVPLLLGKDFHVNY